MPVAPPAWIWNPELVLTRACSRPVAYVSEQSSSQRAPILSLGATLRTSVPEARSSPSPADKLTPRPARRRGRSGYRAKPGLPGPPALRRRDELLRREQLGRDAAVRVVNRVRAGSPRLERFGLAGYGRGSALRRTWDVDLSGRGELSRDRLGNRPLDARTGGIRSSRVGETQPGRGDEEEGEEHGKDRARRHDFLRATTRPFQPIRSMTPHTPDCWEITRND